MRDVSPLIPMAAITGRPDKARIQEVLSAYASVGIDAFLMYPRTGLETEYMSGDWMELCKNVIETAASLNMRVWLYDEYNFPSGNCLGQVTKDKDEFYPNALVFKKHENGYQTRVVRNRVGSDILNPAVVARFIELTHQRYFDAFGAYFGNTVQGIFTDEPSFAYFTRMGAFAEAVDENSFRLPWYDGLEDDYAKATGRSLRHDVISHLNGQTPDALWEHYYSLTGARMRKVYIGEINRWCEAHGIKGGGHLDQEETRNPVGPNGDLMNSNVTNFSCEEFRRVDLDFKITNDCDSNLARGVLLKAAEETAGVQMSPAPFARLTAVDDDTFIFTVRAWCESKIYWDVYFDLLQNCSTALGENGIDDPEERIAVRIVNEEK